MNDELVDWLREDLDAPALDAPPGLVQRAVATGRRRRHRRRVAAGVLGGTLAAAAVVGAVALGGPFGSHAVLVPASTPTAIPSAAPSAAPSATPSATPSDIAPPPSTTGSSSTKVFWATPAAVEKALRDLVPSSYTITRSASDRDDVVGEVSGYLYLRDAQGSATVFGGVGEDASKLTDLCKTNMNCTETSISGGRYWSMHSSPGEKAGDDLTVYFARADGAYVWLTQSNTEDGNGPVTRPELPLTEAQARDLVTDSAWDDVIR